MDTHIVTRFRDFKPTGRIIAGRRIAVGVDIDGCVDPGMYKHETAFAIAAIYEFGLQMVTPMAMRAWMYVNCYSQHRGISRFVALCEWAKLLRNTPAAVQAGIELPEFRFLSRWAEITPSLSPEALSNYLEDGDFSDVLRSGESEAELARELERVLRWSARVNELAVEATENILAFPNAVRSIRELHDMGVDVCAVSGTPEEHVIAHLREYGILDCFTAIFAQQAGKKHAALTTMMAGPQAEFPTTPLLEDSDAQYDAIAMFGDAPQDYREAKKANKILTGAEGEPIRMFFIEAGRENETWGYFRESVLDHFVHGSWSKDSEKDLVTRGLGNLDRVYDPNVLTIDTFAKRPAES